MPKPQRRKKSKNPRQGNLNEDAVGKRLRWLKSVRQAVKNGDFISKVEMADSRVAKKNRRKKVSRRYKL